MFGDYCYNVDHKMLRWEEGEAVCKSLSADLVSYHSMEEKVVNVVSIFRNGIKLYTCTINMYYV